MQRQPAVAGQFYSASLPQLRKDLAALIPVSENKRKILGCIAPHAGYLYSGSVAGKLYSDIELPHTVLILGPNHHGLGSSCAIYPGGSWATPLGSVQICDALNQSLLSSVPYLQPDSLAHIQEHSLEVQLPFLQYMQPNLSLSAICIGQFNDFQLLLKIGHGIATAIRNFGNEVLIVASSDMTHYESAESVHAKDQRALEAVINLDPEALLRICRTDKISMCGVIPAAIMMWATLELGATTAELVSYRTSGDVTGDNRQVVGYASVALW